MRCLIPIFIGFFLVQSSLSARQFLLEYGHQVGESYKYEFKNRFRMRLITIEDVRSRDDVTEGNFFDSVEDMNKEGQALISRKFEIEEYEQNGKELKLKDYEKTLVSEKFWFDPVLGVTAKPGIRTFEMNDLMEMNLPMPGDRVEINEKWKHSYNFQLPTGKKEKIEVPGYFFVRAVKGSTARIVGLFKAKIPKDPITDYEGIVQFKTEFYFNLGKGIIESGTNNLVFKYESRTELAKVFYKEARQQGSKERLGYSMSFKSRYERED